MRSNNLKGIAPEGKRRAESASGLIGCDYIFELVTLSMDLPDNAKERQQLPSQR